MNTGVEGTLRRRPSIKTFKGVYDVFVMCSIQGGRVTATCYGPARSSRKSRSRKKDRILNQSIVSLA